MAAGADKPVQALLFDLDGTLIDSMPLHHDAWRRWFAAQGLAFDEAGFFAATAGRTNAEILSDLLPALSLAEHLELAAQKEAIYQADAATRLAPVAGALALLEQAARRGLRLAVCTAAPDVNVAVALQRFAAIAAIEVLVNPEQGFRGKPHPDLFLEAARRLGVEPAACLVFEDAPLGVEAARRAGMRAVALTTSMPASAFDDFPNLLCAVADFNAFVLDTICPPQAVALTGSP